MNWFFWKAGSGRFRRTYAVVPIGLLILAVLLFSKVEHFGAKEQDNEDQVAAEFTGMVRYEAETMEYWLRVALHEDVPCHGTCNRDEDFSNIVSLLIMRCERFGPEDQERSPYYREEVHGEDLGRIKAACSILTDMAKTSPEISESPEWVEAVTRARQVFNSVMRGFFFLTAAWERMAATCSSVSPSGMRISSCHCHCSRSLPSAETSRCRRGHTGPRRPAETRGCLARLRRSVTV